VLQLPSNELTLFMPASGNRQQRTVISSYREKKISVTPENNEKKPKLQRSIEIKLCQQHKSENDILFARVGQRSLRTVNLYSSYSSRERIADKNRAIIFGPSGKSNRCCCSAAKIVPKEASQSAVLES
jgi:hypothetical protein